MADTLPNAELRNSAPAYIAELIGTIKTEHGLSMPKVAARIGVSLTTVKAWKAGRYTPSYADQYVLERLAGVC